MGIQNKYREIVQRGDSNGKGYRVKVVALSVCLFFLQKTIYIYTVQIIYLIYISLNKLFLLKKVRQSDRI